MRRVFIWAIVASLITLPVPLERTWRSPETVKLPRPATWCAAGETIRKR